MSRTAPGDSPIAPFQVAADQAVLDDLAARLRATRWPEIPVGSGWEAGSSDAFLRELCEYWRDGFDWRAVECSINAWPQIVTTIDGQRVHAIHARSPRPGATPVLLTHGWPGSVLEFLGVLPQLTDPAAYGGDPQDAFHVVCPSLPGFGWSGPTREPGWHVDRVAAAEAELMQRLGYQRFGVQGGDWGAFVSARLAAQFPDRVLGIHLNFVPAGPADLADPLAGLDDADRRKVAAIQDWARAESAYAQLQGTKPHTVGYALNDSPAGLAAWIVEKFRRWSDCGGDVLTRFSRDDLLAAVTTYWVTGTAASSARLYWETARAGGRGPMGGVGPRIEVPTCCAIFPAEIYQPPRTWAERQFRVLRWTEYGSGGHFAAMEEPDAFVADVRAAFRAIRSEQATAESP